jgi:two-component system chemotaxis response regulator CheB
MDCKKKIKVLVVDDSVFFSELISRGIATDPGIEVVATAVDPFDARDKILKYEPDVMTCDIEMPRMNGLEFIQRLMPQYPMPVVVISAASEAVFNAMSAGAVDFVSKPDTGSLNDVEHFIKDLIIKIKIAANANMSLVNSGRGKSEAGDPGSNAGILGKNPGMDTGSGTDIIAIGASTGGTEAICSVLKSLHANIPGIVIVQHIPPVFSRMFAERLNNSTVFDVKEAESGDIVERGRVLVAPGNAHMEIVNMGGRLKAKVFSGDKVNGHCPSVDILFESVAKSCGKRAIGLILTGMGYDGAKGLLSMRTKGARTIGQDEKSCVVYGMPKVAFNIGAVEKQAPLCDIPRVLMSMV